MAQLAKAQTSCERVLRKLRESSFNMTRGDEDIEGGAPKIFRHPKGGL